MPELVAIGCVIVGLAVLAAAVSRHARRRPVSTNRTSPDTGSDTQAVVHVRATGGVLAPRRGRAPDGIDGGSSTRQDDRAAGPAAAPGHDARTDRDESARQDHPIDTETRQVGGGAPHIPAVDTPTPVRLFAMAELVEGSAGGHRHHGPYAAIAVTTTGFTPLRDRIIEVAIVRTDEHGVVRDEFATLVGSPDIDVGPSFLHGITAADLAFVPAFADVADDLLARLEGHVVVAHNGELVEQFLSAEFLRAGLLAPSLPTINLIRLGQRIFSTRNQRLGTVAAHLQLPERALSSAIADARLCTGLLRRVLAGHGDRLTYPIPPAPVLARRGRPAVAPVSRSHPPPAEVGDSWVATLLGRVSMSATEANDPRVAAYVEAMAGILTRGRIVMQEARALTALLAASGYPAGKIRDIQERLLESLREAAFEEAGLSRTQLSHLRAAATSVGIPTYFDDLIPPPQPPAPTPGSGSFARPVRKPLPAAAPVWVARCGHCLGVGHYTSTCPRRRGGGVAPVSPVRPITPI